MGRVTRATAAVAGIALAAAVLRIPAFLASRHLGFDDGVYGASARAMRDGAVPFRAVFSSQGPLFLPLVWLADVVGLRRANSPRLLGLVAAAGLVIATYGAARMAGASRSHARLAGALVGASGAVLWVTGPLTSDGVAEALATATVAVALRYRARPTRGAAIAVGGLAAATLSVKSLLLGITVPVAWAVVRPLLDRRPRIDHIAIVAAVAVAVGLAVALPFGIGRVWDQSVQYHLDAAGARTPGPNIAKTVSTMLARDFPLVAVATAAGIGALVARRGRARTPRTDDAFRIVLAWLVATALVLVLEHPLWRNHVAHIVPPIAVLVALRPPSWRWIAGVLAVAIPWQYAHLGAVLWPAPYHQPAQQAVADIASLPSGTWSISDEPGLVWRAGKRTPPDLVDASRLRIEEGRITTESLVRAARDRRVCTFVIWSRRFADLPGLRAALERDGFVEGRRYDRRRVLFVKNACQLP